MLELRAVLWKWRGQARRFVNDPAFGGFAKGNEFLVHFFALGG